MKKKEKRFEREIFSGSLRKVRSFAGVWKIMVG